MLRNRTILGWALAGLYGAIAVLGEGLHGLPGLGHGCSGEHHGGETCHIHSMAAGGFSSDRAGAYAAEGEHHLACAQDCPICHYFAQAKCFLEMDGLTGESLPVCTHHAITPLCFSLHTLSAYQSRGPPAA
jgi:hypothetical protein